MDFFNTMYWAINGGAYSIWHSIYPPLNFIFLTIINTLSFNDLNSNGGFDLRDKSFFTIYYLFFLYLASPYFILKSMNWIDFSKKKKQILYFSFLISTPMLFVLERGNLIILSLFFLPLLFQPSMYLQILAVAVLINIKPYFALLLILFLVKNKPNSFFMCAALTGLIFVITGVIYDENFIMVFGNIFDFSQIKNQISIMDLLAMPSCISVFLNVFKHPQFINSGYLSIVESLGIDSIIQIIFVSTLSLTVFVILKCSKYLKESHFLTLLIVLITNLSVSVGGYSLIFYLVIIPIFFELKYKKIYTVFLLLLFLPLDIITLASYNIGVQRPFLFGSNVNVVWTEGLGSFLKPIINIMILLTLNIEIFLQQIKLKPITTN